MAGLTLLVIILVWRLCQDENALANKMLKRFKKKDDFFRPYKGMKWSTPAEKLWYDGVISLYTKEELEIMARRSSGHSS